MAEVLAFSRVISEELFDDSLHSLDQLVLGFGGTHDIVGSNAGLARIDELAHMMRLAARATSEVSSTHTGLDRNTVSSHNERGRW